MKKLVDPHGRHIHKLRLALLDACNFRCIYCMPQNPKFMPNDKLMQRDEILRLATSLVNQGIDEIRLTGGEPSLRSDFLDIVKDLSNLNLHKLGLTTNGLHLEKLLPELDEREVEIIIECCNYVFEVARISEADNLNYEVNEADALVFYMMGYEAAQKRINEVLKEVHSYE